MFICIPYIDIDSDAKTPRLRTQGVKEWVSKLRATMRGLVRWQGIEHYERSGMWIQSSSMVSPLYQSIDTLNLFEHSMEPPDASELLLSSMLLMPLYLNIGHVVIFCF